MKQGNQRWGGWWTELQDVGSVHRKAPERSVGKLDQQRIHSIWALIEPVSCSMSAKGDQSCVERVSER